MQIKTTQLRCFWNESRIWDEEVKEMRDFQIVGAVIQNE